MYDICHPTYYNMSQLGCNDQVKLTTAFYVYMELCEVKRYWDVDYKYCESLKLFHLQARKSKNAALETFIPWPAIHGITLELISNIKTVLEKERFTFVFKEGDTTSVYYNVCKGIVKPTDPEKTKVLKVKEHKKFKLDMEIRRNTSNLYERALLIGNDKTDESSGCVGHHLKTESDNSEELESKAPSESQKMGSDENLNNSHELEHNVVSNFDDSQEDESIQNMSNGDECSEHK